MGQLYLETIFGEKNGIGESTDENAGDFIPVFIDHAAGHDQKAKELFIGEENFCCCGRGEDGDPEVVFYNVREGNVTVTLRELKSLVAKLEESCI